MSRAHAREQEPDDFDGPSFEESMRASADTLAARGFASNFVAAWLAFWPYVAAAYGEQLQEAYWRTFVGRRPKTARQIVADVQRSTMALMSAAVRADKSGAQLRRFHCSAWVLQSYRAGLELIPDDSPPEEKKKQRANLGRYWRSHWAVLHLFQSVTGLALFPRESREWHANRNAHEAAAHTDNASDLFLDLTGRGARFRPGLSRVARFERATAEAVEAFRSRVGEYAPGYVMPAPPECDAHVKDFLRIEGKQKAAEEAESVGEDSGAKIIKFRSAKRKLLAGVEAVLSLAESEGVTPEEADELVMMLAPIAALARGGESSKGIKDVVTLEDSEKSTPVSEGADCVFAGKSEDGPAVSADVFIRPSNPAEVTLDAFLAAFRPDPAEPVQLRTFKPKGAPDGEPRFAARVIPATRRTLAEGGGLLSTLRKANGANGVYFVVNQGGDRDEDINRITAFFAEADEQSVAEQHALLDACPLPPSIRVETKKSVHAYWPAAPGCSVEEWREVQRRLIHYFKSDPKIKNPSRVMRLPSFNHVAYREGLLDFKPVECVAFDPARRFTARDLLAVFPAPVAEQKPKPRRGRVSIFDLTGTFEAYKRELGARISEHDTARRNGRGNWDCQAVCHGGKGSTGLFFDPSANSIICNKGCDLQAIAAAFSLGPHTPTPTPAPPSSDGRVRGTL